MGARPRRSRTTGRTRSSAPPSPSSCSNFEETGGIVAAHTTSIPEAPGSGRTWDYRYCWLRDAYFVVQGAEPHRRDPDHGGFHLLHPRASLRIANERCGRSTASFRSIRWTRRTAPQLKGYRGDGPVRIGNAAAEQDAARRLRQRHPGRDADVLRPAAAAARRRRAVSAARDARREGGELALEPDAGIWEYRGAQSHPHPFGRDVLGRLPPARRHRRPSRSHERAAHWNGRSPIRCRKRLLKRAWNEKRQAFTRRVRIRRPRRQRAAAARSRRDRGRATRASSAPSKRWSANFCAGSTLCAMRLPTISACRRRPF